jgi:hypothetical protein
MISAPSAHCIAGSSCDESRLWPAHSATALLDCFSGSANTHHLMHLAIRAPGTLHFQKLQYIETADYLISLLAVSVDRHLCSLRSIHLRSIHYLEDDDSHTPWNRHRESIANGFGGI